MRAVLTLSALSVLTLVVNGSAQADDVTKALIEKAIKAHGGKEKLTKETGVQMSGKGTIYTAGLEIPFEQQSWIQPPNKLKEVVELNVNGMNMTVSSVFNGKKGWINANGMEMELDENLIKEFKESIHLMRVIKVAFLQDKSVKLSPLGDKKVDGRDTTGVRVETKGYKAVNLYFDKKTNMIKMIERQAYDAASSQEVAEQRIIKEYQEADGMKFAKKIVVTRDGLKYLEYTVGEVQFPDKIEDSEFAKP